jgi:hypothetical protein
VGLAFTVVALGFHHLNLSNRLSHGQQARNLAESALSLTVEKVLKAEGDYPRPGNHTVRVAFAGTPENAFGMVTFDEVVAAEYGLDRSTNNLKNETAMTSPAARTVPGQSVHIVGLGRCKDVAKRVEAILHVPIFRSGIASEAPLQMTGPAIVASAEENSDDALLTRPENFLSKLLPAHVTTNRDAQLGSDILVTGFCQAVGAIDLGTGNATVRGGTRAHDGISEVPKVDVREFDPNKLGSPHALEARPGGVFVADGGLIRMSSSVTGSELVLPDGVNKSGALVYVDGNITVNEIRGVGAVVATGNISVRGSTNLSTDGTVALLAGADLALKGDRDNADAIIKGIAYSGGSMSVENVTLVGTMVQAGTGAAAGLKVSRANVIRTDEDVSFEFGMPFGTDAGAGNLAQSQKPFRIVSSKPLSQYYDDSLDQYARDVNKDGKFEVGVDEPANPVKAGDIGVMEYTIDGEEVGVITDPDAAVQYMVLAKAPDPHPSWAAFLQTLAPDFMYDNAASETQNMRRYIVNEQNRHSFRLNNDMVKIAQFYHEFKLQDKKGGKISFDPSRFLTLSQAARIILWRDL